MKLISASTAGSDFLLSVFQLELVILYHTSQVTENIKSILETCLVLRLPTPKPNPFPLLTSHVFRLDCV